MGNALATPSPKECNLAGARLHRVIPYSDEFIMLTRPTTRTGYAIVHRSRGLTVNGLHYWHERCAPRTVVGRRVPVRYEPYDMGVVYAFLMGSGSNVLRTSLRWCMGAQSGSGNSSWTNGAPRAAHTARRG